MIETSRSLWAPTNPGEILRGSATSGLTWLFRTRRAADPEILSLMGLDRACLRSAKMARVEAVLLVSDSALTTRRLATLATLADAAEAKSLIEQLNAAYDHASSAFRIERVASGHQLLTRPQFAHWLGKLHQRQAELKLTASEIHAGVERAVAAQLARKDDAGRPVVLMAPLRLFVQTFQANGGEVVWH